MHVPIFATLILIHYGAFNIVFKRIFAYIQIRLICLSATFISFIYILKMSLTQV